MHRTMVLLAMALLSLAPVAAAPALPLGSEIASGGFGRPQRLDVVEAGSDLRVAIAGGDEPAVVWEDAEGLRVQALEQAEPRRLVTSRGIRDLAAGAAGDDPVVVWSERDLASGRTRFDWRWRDETRTLFATRPSVLVRLVSGSDRPELLAATPGPEGWTLSLHDWDGGVREMAPRSLTVAGLDALRDGGEVRIAWLEGSDEVVLGQVEREWTAYLATWPDGREEPDRPSALGPAVRVGSGDAVRIATVEGALHALWPGPDGTLRTTGPDGGADDLGTGVPLGWFGGAWTWVEGAELRRSAGGGEEATTVLRLPSAPERVVAGEHGGVIAVAWSSGRYLGGIEVWAASDRTAYRARFVERVATAMGWDPWRPWSAAGGHLLLALLTAVLGASVFTPVWWLGAALLARRHGVSPGVAALEGAAVAVLSVLAVMAVMATRATFDTADLRALLGGPALIGGAAAAGILAAWLVGRRQDVEATFGRLVAAWVAGGTMLFVLAFGTLQAWQRLFGAVA